MIGNKSQCKNLKGVFNKKKKKNLKVKNINNKRKKGENIKVPIEKLKNIIKYQRKKVKKL